MATFAKNKLSGSTNGKGILVAANSSPGTTIHTAVSGTTNWDEIILYVSNSDTVEYTLTIEYGGTTSPNDLIVAIIPPRSALCPITERHLILNNSLIVKAFASTANKLSIFGSVTEIR